MKLPIAQIIEGHAKEALGLDTDISEARLKICHRCPLFSNALGGMCNSRLWLNVETGDVSTNARPGYQNGCGCRLNAKTRLINAHCPVNKW